MRPASCATRSSAWSLWPFDPGKRETMPISARKFASAALIGAILLALSRQPRAGEAAAPAASPVEAGGVTLHSVRVRLPGGAQLFPGGSKADAINNNCLTCHSAGMVLNQPSLSRTEWQAEVDRMRTAYKAPIDAGDVPAIVNYLVKLSAGAQQSAQSKPRWIQDSIQRAGPRVRSR